MKRLELMIVSGESAGRRYAVPPTGLRLGRSSSNDLLIRDAELSRNHCYFEPFGEAGVRLTDLASANGTFVNDVRLGVEAAELKVGDRIRVGGTSIVVVSPEPPQPAEDIDLGLGGGGRAPGGSSSPAADTASKPGSPPHPHSRRQLILWSVAAVAIVGAGGLFFFMPPAATPPAKTVEIVQRPEQLLTLGYEKVEANCESIFRYWIGLDDGGRLTVVIDDLAGEGRHVNRVTTLKPGAVRRLCEIMLDEGLFVLEPSYVGPASEPPVLFSRVLTFATSTRNYAVSVVNATEPEALLRVGERLEAFAMNELGIRALQYTRDQLITMARTAADTGRMKWEDRDVEYGNLFAAVRAFREAIDDLETVNPKPAEFADCRDMLERAEKEIDLRYRNLRFEADQASNVGNWDKALEAFKTICELIPDREDERNHEASVKMVDVENRIKKRGGR